VFDKSGATGRIECWQTLNAERMVAVLDFNLSFALLTIDGGDTGKCVLSVMPNVNDAAYARFQVNGDSMLDILTILKLHIKCSIFFQPEYDAAYESNRILIDPVGGVGFYPCKNLTASSDPDRTDGGYVLNYEFNHVNRFLVSVFPPRQFNVKQSYDDRIYHWGGYRLPDDDMLRRIAETSTILVLHHDTIWKGKYTYHGRPVTTVTEIYADASYSPYYYDFLDEARMIEVLKLSRELGLRVVPYMSPFYSMARDDDFFERAEAILTKFGFDGLYFDGIALDVIETYRIIKRARALIGDGFLYYHCTGDPIGTRAFCPFIDAYADCILRAEHIRNFDETYLRYVISGRNISNTIGLACTSGYSDEFLEWLAANVFRVGARMYFYNDEHIEKLLTERYLPELERQRAAEVI
jgi:hypothetical protein